MERSIVSTVSVLLSGYDWLTLTAILDFSESKHLKKKPIEAYKNDYSCVFGHVHVTHLELSTLLSPGQHKNFNSH